MFTLSCDVQIGKISQSRIDGEDIPESTPMLRLVSHLEHPSLRKRDCGALEVVSGDLKWGRLKLLSGEKICQATLASKREFKEKFNVEGETDSGRKVELLLKVGDLEILNTEAKASNNEALCEEQYKKRLSAMVCHLKKAGDNVFVAGAAVSRMITLPKNKEELHTFLEGPSSRILWNYVLILLEYQNQVRRKLDEIQETSTTISRKRQIVRLDDNSSIALDMPLNLQFNIGEATFLTPKRSTKFLNIGLRRSRILPAPNFMAAGDDEEE
ncbi:hypothetical protein BGZ76_005093 [Entomortierella beljakovae]|nr:hypothetical protein BGZ76_005093 [Entomortierella beljakovae]